MKSKIVILSIFILIFITGCELLIKLEKDTTNTKLSSETPTIYSPKNKIYTESPIFSYNTSYSNILSIELNNQSIIIDNNSTLSMSKNGFNKLTVIFYLNGNATQKNVEYFMNIYSIYNTDDFNREDNSDPTLPENNWTSETDTSNDIIKITNNQFVCEKADENDAFTYISDIFSFTDYEENLFSIQINKFENPNLNSNKIILGPIETLGILKKSSNGLFRLELQNENFILIQESENDFSLDLSSPHYLYYYNNMDNNDYVLFLTDNSSNIIQKINITRNYIYFNNEIGLGFFQTYPENNNGTIIELDNFTYSVGPLIQ